MPQPIDSQIGTSSPHSPPSLRPGRALTPPTIEPGEGCAGSRCIAEDSVSGGPTVSASNAQAIQIKYIGGEAGRTINYNMICDPTAATGAGPSTVAPSSRVVNWPTPHACGKVAPASQCPAPPPLALPTKEQLAWQGFEIGARKRDIRAAQDTNRMQSSEGHLSANSTWGGGMYR